MDGWIKLHRKIRNNHIFNNLQLLRLWIICLTEATHKPRDQIIGRQIVKLVPGQFVTGRFNLCDMYNKGLTRDQQKTPKTVWRWLEVLKSGDFLTISTTNKYSIVTVVNWDLYQENDQQFDQQVTNKRPTNDQQVTTNKNVKNDKNDKNDKKVKYAEFVSMTTAEYKKLVDQYGEDNAKEMISVLDNYKGSNGKRYKSDYRAILNWVVDRVESKFSKGQYFSKDQQKLEILKKYVNQEKGDAHDHG